MIIESTATPYLFTYHLSPERLGCGGGGGGGGGGKGGLGCTVYTHMCTSGHFSMYMCDTSIDG